MNSIITPKQMTDYMLETLNKVVQDIPADQREEAKAKILEAFGAYMFKGPAKEIKERPATQNPRSSSTIAKPSEERFVKHFGVEE